MKFISKTEYFKFDKPIGEPDVKFYENEYLIQRKEDDKVIIWFGLETNWKYLKSEKVWKKLTTDNNIEPLDIYFPDVIYPENKTYYKECKEPIYETKYKEYYGKI